MCDKYQESTGIYGAAKAQYRQVERQTIGQALEKEAMSQPLRQSFVESLAARIHRAESNASEATRLRRLAELFDKHPDVREMFELVRDLGVL